jgi:hypothetical protein
VGGGTEVEKSKKDSKKGKKKRLQRGSKVSKRPGGARRRALKQLFPTREAPARRKLTRAKKKLRSR